MRTRISDVLGIFGVCVYVERESARARRRRRGGKGNLLTSNEGKSVIRQKERERENREFRGTVCWLVLAVLTLIFQGLEKYFSFMPSTRQKFVEIWNRNCSRNSWLVANWCSYSLRHNPTGEVKFLI